MQINSYYSSNLDDPYAGIEFAVRHVEIRESGGESIFSGDVEVPVKWSDTAASILAQKYLRKAGVPGLLCKVLEDGIPHWLQRSAPDGIGSVNVFGGEQSAKQIFHRMAGTWAYWGLKGKYFDAHDALKFYV